jgi:hypothetical protein
MPIHPNIPKCHYWHRTLYRSAKKLELPALEDGNAVQVAINRVLQSMVDGNTDIRTGCGLLYGLQLARDNMKQVTVEAKLKEEQEREAHEERWKREDERREAERQAYLREREETSRRLRERGREMQKAAIAVGYLPEPRPDSAA